MSRVGAFISARDDDKVIEFLGYGEYVGCEVPPEEVGGYNMGLPNPKIKLDNGETVWGCQCWWGPEVSIQRKLKEYEAAGYTIRTMTLAQAIKEHE